VNLLHEIAHSFDSKCGGGHYYDLITQDRSKPGSWSRSYQSRIHEPTYKQYEDHEMGLYMEYETFGGRVHPINIDFSARHGLNVYLGNAHAKPSTEGVKATDAGQPYSWAIPMGYMEELHQQSFWAKEASEGRLLIPRQGVHAYGLNSMSTVAWRHHLLETDTAHTFEEMDMSFDDQVHLAKKQKLEVSDSNTRSQKSPKRRQLLQTKIRTYPSKAEAAAADAKAMLIAQASMKDDASMDGQLAQHVSSYVPPPARQPAIDETFGYLNSEDHLYNYDPQLEQTSDSYDPLSKQPHELTIFDKWLLVEDYALLTTDWTSGIFLAKRALLESYSRKYSKASSSPDRESSEGATEDKQWPLYPVPQRLIPDYDNPGNWNQKDFRFLRYLRKSNPAKGLLAERKKRREERDARVRLWKARSEMEELLVLKGGSRVAWLAGGERAKNEENRVGLTGLGACEGDIDAWEQRWRPILLTAREEDKEKEMEVSPRPEDDTEKIETGDATQSAITQYFNLTASQRVLRGMDDEEGKKVEAPSPKSEAPGESQSSPEPEIDPASPRRSWRRQTNHLTMEQEEREREQQEQLADFANKDSDGDEILDDEPLELPPVSFSKTNQALSTRRNADARERNDSLAEKSVDENASDGTGLDKDGDEVLNDEPGDLPQAASASQSRVKLEKTAIKSTPVTREGELSIESDSEDEESGEEIS
jgi:hypothetical protein